ncbi:hypothetical protein [Halarcobacter ebronensis]|uniref:Uncharacterized protein n=1 Tax=Halarcobacter ebronensis TaxID=1462615 RepID=A0A4Q1API8_9BACT|nr:hypothetical protein [Halarcobacter ebronensis]QKF82097.1 hypothetical protein AEBR_1614 [Halarcobacter ebronensis]RXK04073.1 hypothetical protein CRV07_11635 [Halarcobacter ebronensis]
MTVNNNLSSMLAIQMEVNQMAQNIAQVSQVVADPELRDMASDLTSSLIEQIPQTIAYSANETGIVTQMEVMDSLLDIKA